MVKKLICIVGPTASGKSKLAINLALLIKEKFNKECEIINIDSRSIYKNCPIVSAAELTKNPVHHLVNIFPPQENIDAYLFTQFLNFCIKSIIKKNKIPILCGGTGFYFDMFFNPPINSKTSKNLRNILEKFFIFNNFKSKILNLLQNLFNLPTNIIDKKRIIRFLEMIILNGKIIERKKHTEFSPLYFMLNIDRKTLKERIKLRVEKMYKMGMVRETINLLKINASPLVLEGIGYKEVLENINYGFSYNNLITQVTKRTYKFAKRQLTWFKKFEPIIISSEYDILKYLSINMIK